MDARPAAGTMFQETVKSCNAGDIISPEVEQMRKRAAGNRGETKIINPSEPSGHYMYHQAKY
jgi:hypothetical protein